MLQDTTEFSYQRANPERIGFRGLSPSRRDATGKLRLHLVCGVLMHGSLAVTPGNRVLEAALRGVALTG